MSIARRLCCRGVCFSVGWWGTASSGSVLSLSLSASGSRATTSQKACRGEFLVEKIEPMPEHQTGAVCLAGERACPPEDCGGVHGYARLLRVLKKASTPDDRELRRWAGRYDPERFVLENVNRELRSLETARAK